MQTHLIDYSEPTFKRVSSVFNSAEKTVSELIIQPKIKIYRRIVTLRKVVNQVLRIPQKTKIIRIPERVAKTNIQNTAQEVFYWKKLNKNIIVEHKKFKNKEIISVKTDIETKFLKRI